MWSPEPGAETLTPERARQLAARALDDITEPAGVDDECE